MSLEFGRRITDIPASPEFAGGFDSYGNAITFGPHRIGSPDDTRLEQKWGISPNDMTNRIAKALSMTAIREKSGGKEDGTFEEPPEDAWVSIIDITKNNNRHIVDRMKEITTDYFINNSTISKKGLCIDEHELTSYSDKIRDNNKKINLFSPQERDYISPIKYSHESSRPIGAGVSFDYIPLSNEVRFDTPSLEVTIPAHSVIATDGKDGQAPVVLVENEEWHF